MTDYFEGKAHRPEVEEAVSARLVQWKGEDAIDLLRDLNSIAVRIDARRRS